MTSKSCRQLESKNKPVSTATLSLAAVAAAAMIGLAAPAGASDPILVTNGNDDGDGSLRAALEAAAKQDGQITIMVVTDDDIAIKSSLTYAGQAPLAIYGDGQTVSSNTDTTLLTLSQGAALAVNDLKFRGPGGFSINNQGKGKGIFVDVRDDQTGVVKMALQNVSVSDVAYHGIHISDCDLGDACGAGASGEGKGSPASIEVRFTNVRIAQAGVGKFDGDGIRVDERGDGDIIFHSQNSRFTDVGADGVELDEAQNGDVVSSVVDNRFSDNGGYCDVDVLKSFLPDPVKGEFEDGKATDAEAES